MCQPCLRTRVNDVPGLHTQGEREKERAHIGGLGEFCKGLPRERPLQNPGKDCASPARPGSFQVRRRQIPVFTGMTKKCAGMTEAFCKGLKGERPLRNPGVVARKTLTPTLSQGRGSKSGHILRGPGEFCKGLPRERPLQNPGKDCASPARPGSFQVRRRQIPVFTGMTKKCAGMTEAFCKGLKGERPLRNPGVVARKTPHPNSLPAGEGERAGASLRARGVVQRSSRRGRKPKGACVRFLYGIVTARSPEVCRCRHSKSRALSPPRIPSAPSSGAGCAARRAVRWTSARGRKALSPVSRRRIRFPESVEYAGGAWANAPARAAAR